MFEGRSEEVVRDLSNVKQEIISYRKIIKPERSTLRVLERRVENFLHEELELYFDDIVDAAERIWDLLDNYKEVVEGLESTNESVISHRQNDVLRLLTVFTVIVLPLTMLTGVFGMNVAFPGEARVRPSGSSSRRSSPSSPGWSGSSAGSAGYEHPCGLAASHPRLRPHRDHRGDERAAQGARFRSNRSSACASPALRMMSAFCPRDGATTPQPTRRNSTCWGCSSVAFGFGEPRSLGLTCLVME